MAREWGQWSKTTVSGKYWLEVSTSHHSPCASGSPLELEQWLSLSGWTDSVSFINREWLLPCEGNFIDGLLEEIVASDLNQVSSKEVASRRGAELIGLFEDLQALLGLDEVEPWRRYEFARWFRGQGQSQGRRYSPETDVFFSREQSLYQGAVWKLTTLISGHLVCPDVGLHFRKGWGW
ncbi:hypothetical protein [Cystobacter fuscus]|uniref:hypothetical protein n=1 Tax=Cystobacter fuscus TaxID=43 RepID=UPI002B29F4B2|nr:hypothetical protein F0U63_03340 [Cystobacter fuscus]